MNQKFRVGGRFRWRRPGFVAGIVVGVILVFGVRLFINRTSVADWLISPLLVSDTGGTGDAIVGLGAGVTGECFPSQNGVGRVLLSARLWRERRAPIVVFTGGAGGASCAIAEAMARLAKDVGVDERSLRVEAASRTTRENGERTAPLLRELGVRRVIVVTDRLHMRRAAGIFAQQGFDIERVSVPIYEGYTDNVSMLAAGAREFVALAYYRMRGWGEPIARWERREHGGANEQVNQRPVENAQSGVTRMQNRRYPSGPIVVLGASYAQGWQPKSIASVPMINRGIEGHQSWEMLERFERDVVSQAPRAVILWGFINDIFRAHDVEPALTRVRESYEGMIALARQSGIEPVIATEVTVRPPDTWREIMAGWLGALRGKESYQDRVNRHVLATNRWLVDLARKHGLVLLDLHAAVGDGEGRRRREFTQEDGSHITPAGYAAVTAYAVPILEAHVVQAR